MFGEESIEAMKTGLAMMLLAAVLILGLTNIISGTDIVQSYFDSFDTKEDATTSVVFQDFVNGGEVVPVAAAYALINYNADDISYIHCQLNGHNNTFLDYTKSCLTSHIRGQCLLKATYNESTNTYDIYLCSVR